MFVAAALVTTMVEVDSLQAEGSAGGKVLSVVWLAIFLLWLASFCWYLYWRIALWRAHRQLRESFRQIEKDISMEGYAEAMWTAYKRNPAATLSTMERGYPSIVKRMEDLKRKEKDDV